MIHQWDCLIAGGILGGDRDHIAAGGELRIAIEGKVLAVPGNGHSHGHRLAGSEDGRVKGLAHGEIHTVQIPQHAGKDRGSLIGFRLGIGGRLRIRGGHRAASAGIGHIVNIGDVGRSQSSEGGAPEFKHQIQIAGIPVLPQADLYAVPGVKGKLRICALVIAANLYACQGAVGIFPGNGDHPQESFAALGLQQGNGLFGGRTREGRYIHPQLYRIAAFGSTGVKKLIGGDPALLAPAAEHQGMLPAVDKLCIPAGLTALKGADIRRGLIIGNDGAVPVRGLRPAAGKELGKGFVVPDKLNIVKIGGDGNGGFAAGAVIGIVIPHAQICLVIPQIQEPGIGDGFTGGGMDLMGCSDHHANPTALGALDQFDIGMVGILGGEQLIAKLIIELEIVALSLLGLLPHHGGIQIRTGNIKVDPVGQVLIGAVRQGLGLAEHALIPKPVCLQVKQADLIGMLAAAGKIAADFRGEPIVQILEGNAALRIQDGACMDVEDLAICIAGSILLSDLYLECTRFGQRQGAAGDRDLLTVMHNRDPHRDLFAAVIGCGEPGKIQSAAVRGIGILLQAVGMEDLRVRQVEDADLGGLGFG